MCFPGRSRQNARTTRARSDECPSEGVHQPVFAPSCAGPCAQVSVQEHCNRICATIVVESFRAQILEQLSLESDTPKMKTP